MIENVQDIWVLSLNHCTNTHYAMNNLSGSNAQSSKQDLEMGPTRTKANYDHCKKFLQ